MALCGDDGASRIVDRIAARIGVVEQENVPTSHGGRGRVLARGRVATTCLIQSRLPWTICCGQGINDPKRWPPVRQHRTNATADQTVAGGERDDKMVDIAVDEVGIILLDRR